IFFTSISYGGLFRDIPSAKTPDEARSLRQERKLSIIKHYSKQPIGQTFSDGSHAAFSLPAIARAYFNLDAEVVNRIILNPSFKPYAKVGSNFTAIPYLCERKGDYDFALTYLIQLAYLSKKNNFLNSMAYNKLIFELLNTVGNEHYSHFWLGMCGRYEDTENHILMIESARYLTNQLRAQYLLRRGYNLPQSINNNRNGFNDWIINHLEKIKAEYFDEYNSRPYQGYALMPIVNLATYAENKKVKETARSLLDHMSQIFAIQSSSGTRSVPFRRQLAYEGRHDATRGDGEIARHAIMVGMLDFYPSLEKGKYVRYGKNFMLITAVSDYEMNDETLRLFFPPYKRPFYQKMSHQTPELYYSSKSFHLSAGGAYVNRLDGATKLNDGWARPTLLKFHKRPETHLKEHFRFWGHRHRLRRRNTCVYKNFACGLNFSFPKYFDSSCGVEKGGLKFFDMSSTACGNISESYVAVKINACDTFLCRQRGKNIGLMEVRESSDLAFSDFINIISSSNPDTPIKGTTPNKYITSFGEEIEYIPARTGRKKWEITEINGKKTSEFFRDWPLFDGDILNSHSK
ncbi:MAG: hypothetical protein CME61_06215, partial [Halobacteriovoraceae bacterium]|nr:hypothetical protein [Halobacteriovoraceae bacterium]